MSEEVYLSNPEWIKTHDNIGGVKATIIFKNNMTYEDFEKIFKSTYFILCDENYIINLKNQLQQKENIIKEVREYLKFLKEHYKELRTSPVEDSYFINDMLRQMFIQSIENYLLGIEEILEKENI